MTNPVTHPIAKFLKALDSSDDATFNIETYTDLPKGEKKPHPDPLLHRYANLSIQAVEELIPKLDQLNRVGAGIFVARNQCQGHRSAENVIRVRGIHADLDGVDEEQLAAIRQRLKPTIEVCSGAPDRRHLYWNTVAGDELSKAEAKAINQHLTTLGADRAAVDVSRSLRVPGTFNMKYREAGRTPMVELIAIGPKYAADEIRRAFPPEGALKSPRAAVNSGLSGPTTSHNRHLQVSTITQAVRAGFPALWAAKWQEAVTASGVIGYESQSQADLALAGHIARRCIAQGIVEPELGQLIDEVFSASPAGGREKWKERADYREMTIAKALEGIGTEVVPNGNQLLSLTSHGDIRNANAFAELSRERFIYVTSRDRWLQWQQNRWQLCLKQEELQQAKQVVTEIMDAATTAFKTDPEHGKRLVIDAMQAHNLHRMLAMTKLAASEPGMAATEQELDAHPQLLGVQNGVIDLKSGLFQSNRPELKITRYCNANFDEDATCPVWGGFLDQIFDYDNATIEAVQTLLGCTLLGHSAEEILVICYGHGSNGKSVFANVVHHILGGYAAAAPSSLLSARRKDDHSPRNDIAALAGTRYVGINEMQAGDRLDEQVVKVLAGREPITARFLHQELFTFMPTFTPWLRTNHKPVIVGEDDGIWRRLILLPFARKFEAHEQDPRLEEKLLTERDGILMWMVRGAQAYLEHGVRQSPKMKAELRTYRTESDLIGEFLTDKTTADSESKVDQSHLYLKYRLWCDGSGLRPISKKSFTLRLAERGFAGSKSGASRFYDGLSLETA